MFRELIFAGLFFFGLLAAASGQSVSCDVVQFGLIGPIPPDVRPMAGVWCMASHPGAGVFRITVDYEVDGAKHSVSAFVEANSSGNAMYPFVLGAHVGDFKYLGASVKAYAEQPQSAKVAAALGDLGGLRNAACLSDPPQPNCLALQREWLRVR